MRRLLFTTAFALFLAIPLWAQHGGGHFSGGHASFSNGHGSGVSGRSFSGSRLGGRAYSGSHSASGFSSQRGFSRGPFLHNGNRISVRTRGYRNGCFGFRCRTGFAYPWVGYSSWLWNNWWDTDSRFDADYYNNLALANQMDQESIGQQRMFRQEQEDNDQDIYAPRFGVPPASATQREQGSPMPPPTVLVFRDEHRQEVQNYAIVGQTLWNFAPHRTEKIPLSVLDLTTTEKVNDYRGVTFRVPTQNEAQ